MMAADGGIKLLWGELGQMDRAALRVAWAGAFGDAPPHFLSMIFMRKALIWQEQCRKLGGLKPDLMRARIKSWTLLPFAKTAMADAVFLRASR